MSHQPHRPPRARLRHGLALAFLLAVPAAAQKEPPAAPATGTLGGTLSGTVVDAEDRPVAGARVMMDGNAVGKTTVVAEAVTGADGRFRLGPVDPVYRHMHHLRVEADGLAPAVVGDRWTYSVFPGLDNNLGRIRLDRGRTFSGRVVDADGKPVAGAAVEHMVIRRHTPHRSAGDAIVPARTLTTDAEGRFKTPPLPVAFLSVQVRAAGYQQAGWGLRPIRPGGEEDLEPLRLERDVPITGVVEDEQGRPLEGVRVYAGEVPYEATDAAGRFAIRGHGLKAHFELNVWKRRYRHFSRPVERNERGLWFKEPGPDGKPVHQPVRELRVVLTAFSQIEGRVVDDETGQPVRLDRLVLCFCERGPKGELVLSGCTSDGFEQPEPGRFRVSYGDVGDYHLTLTAAGYHDGEAVTQKKPRLEPIDVGVVRMRKNKEGTKPTVARQEIAGTVTRDGVPVKAGWVGLWRLGPPSVTNHLYLARGRTIHARWPIVYASAPVRDGKYTLEVPFHHDQWYVVAEEPGQSLTQLGPVAVGVNERKTLDIACAGGGSVSGQVSGVPEEWAGHAWVVAFNKTGVRADARVDATGRFRLDRLPPGEYGLKVGHDAYRDAEAIDPDTVPPEMRGKPADAWKRATVVHVEAGRDAKNVSLELPAE